jgi:prepilin-type N-terminal cleavage/methylation domain-containing protein/prepilin-type processing-associated H-X9-DG protein
MKSKQQQAGFTLIELLVVIAIIAILASLLMAGLSRAKMQAELTVCRNNLRQIELGLSLYATDFHAYPAHAQENASSLWFRVLERYVGGKWPQSNVNTARSGVTSVSGTYACPGYSRLPGLYIDSLAFVGPWGAYAYNHSGTTMTDGSRGHAQGLGGVFYVSGSELKWEPTTDTEIASPANMIAFGDSLLNVGHGSDGVAIRVGSIISPVQGFTRLEAGMFDPEIMPGFSPGYLTKRHAFNARRHGGRRIISFVDGHVESGSLQQFFQVRNKPERGRRWNVDNQPHLNQVGEWDWGPE